MPEVEHKGRVSAGQLVIVLVGTAALLTALSSARRRHLERRRAARGRPWPAVPTRTREPVVVRAPTSGDDDPVDPEDP